MATSASRSPVLGYNHNVRYNGRIYHVQTEDSGPGKSHIFTHLFHEGHILGSLRLDYREPASDDDVRGFMQDQHKSILKELKRGAFDGKIQALFEALGQDADGPSTPAEADAGNLHRGETTQIPASREDLGPSPAEEPPTAGSQPSAARVPSHIPLAEEDFVFVDESESAVPDGPVAGETTMPLDAGELEPLSASDLNLPSLGSAGEDPAPVAADATPPAAERPALQRSIPQSVQNVADATQGASSGNEIAPKAPEPEGDLEEIILDLDALPPAEESAQVWVGQTPPVPEGPPAHAKPVETPPVKPQPQPSASSPAAPEQPKIPPRPGPQVRPPVVVIRPPQRPRPQPTRPTGVVVKRSVVVGARGGVGPGRPRRPRPSVPYVVKEGSHPLPHQAVRSPTAGSPAPQTNTRRRQFSPPPGPATISDQSLDEVILAYLSQDKDEG